MVVKNYLIIFREPDGRQDPHTPNEIQEHRAQWKHWFAENKDHLTGGSALSLAGIVIRGWDEDQQVDNQPHYTNGLEIVGGYLLQAESLTHATALIKTCPALVFGAFAEIREEMKT